MQFNCPTCSSTLSLPDDSAGRRAQCPSCQAVFRVPELVASADQGTAVAAVIKPGRTDSVGCPGCDKLLAFNADSAGQVVICPACQRRVGMPTAASMQIESQIGYPDRSSRPPTSPGSFATAPDAPLIRRDVDPYASPPVTSVSDGLTNPAQYAPPGWCLFGISIANLGYDLVWTAMISLGLLVDNAGADADAVLGFVFFFLWALLSILIHGVTLVAGLRMTQRRSLSTARLGAILGLIPCGICSVIQIPLAIWAIVVLYNPNAARDFAE